MPPRIHGYLHQPLLVSCSVHSPLPFRRQLWWEGARLGKERHFQIQGTKPPEGWMRLEDLDCGQTKPPEGWMRLEDLDCDPPPQLVPVSSVTMCPGETTILSCQVLGEAPYNLTALLNIAFGRCVGSRHARATLDPPPQLVPVPSVTVCPGENTVSSVTMCPGETTILSCQVLGEAPYNLTWVWDWQVLLVSTGSHTASQPVLGDLPSISVINAVVLAAVGEEAVLPCEASGVPPHRVIWYQGVVPEDQALYVCEAQNIFGKVQAEACLIMTGHGSLVGLERRA
ncbi:hypothetical protein CB1_000583001, partial [Camelus ferus]